MEEKFVVIEYDSRKPYYNRVMPIVGKFDTQMPATDMAMELNAKKDRNLSYFVERIWE